MGTLPNKYRRIKISALQGSSFRLVRPDPSGPIIRESFSLLLLKMDSSRFIGTGMTGGCGNDIDAVCHKLKYFCMFNNYSMLIRVDNRNFKVLVCT